MSSVTCSCFTFILEKHQAHVRHHASKTVRYPHNLSHRHIDTYGQHSRFWPSIMCIQNSITCICMVMNIQEIALDIRIVIMTLCICLTPTVTSAAPTASPAVTARVVSLDPANPDHTRIGALTYLWGYELSSADTRFGGWSGLALDPTGKVLYAKIGRAHV